MSGLQHSLEPNGRSIRFNNSANGAASQQNGSTYIRAGAPNIPPQALTTNPQHHPQPNQLAEFNRNPLLCLLCNQAFQNPCLLACYHTFCAACLKGKAVDGKLACPLCGKSTPLRDGHSLPPSDHLLRFLVESTCEEIPKCANCDRNEKSPMFFCNTCGQALCGQCRDETHRAKMFSQHEVIHMSKKTKDNAKKCSLHGEPYTMFCTTKKAMLCMKCFRDTSTEARRYCVDLDTAYNQGAKKLDRALTSIKELQTSLRDGVILFRSLLEELRRNMEGERDGIMATYAKLIDALKKQYELLLSDLESQYTTKDGELKAQLHSVGTLLPTVQMHLILCTTFTSTANKHEFLTLAYQLIDRLTALAHLTYPLRPGQNGEIKTNYKSAYVSAMEPIMAGLAEGDASSSSTVAVSSGGGRGSKSPYGGVGTYPPHRSSSRANNHDNESTSRFVAAGGATLSRLHMMQQQGPQAQEAIKRQTMSARGLSDKEFTKHCRGFDVQIKGLNNKFNSIKNQVSNLHRDVTTRRCLTSYKQVENIVIDCASLTDEIEQTDQLMRERKELFHKMWEEEQQRITIEQTIFKEQLTELCMLRDDLRQLMEIAQQLEPYIKSITSLMEQIQPEVGGSTAQDPEPTHAQPLPTSAAKPNYNALPANFSRHYNDVPPTTQQTLLPERIQTAVSLAEYKSRLETSSRPESSSRSSRHQQYQQQQQQQRMSPFDELMAQHQQQLQRERQLLRLSSRRANEVDSPKIPPIPPSPPLAGKLDDIPLAEPPFEYSTPARAELPKKSLSETTADVKKGLLSSILEKVRSKEEADQAVAARSKANRLMAPLASSESLSVSETSSKRAGSTTSSNLDSTKTVVKPYEPPGLGKPSRVTPVGLDEEPDALSQDSLLESESVEVLSVIRFNKKLGSSTGTSDKRSSSSDTNSLFNNLPCPACDASEKSNNSKRVRSRSATRATETSSNVSQELTSLASESMTVETSTTTGSLPSIIRRSSAPEIDESLPPEALSRISEVTCTSACDTAVSEAVSTYSRSLDRPRRPPNVTIGAVAASDSSAACSDSETSNLASNRASVPSLDKKDLQRAVAHLQETLQKQMLTSEVKAVVHRGPEARTLDGQSIKQYESIKLNQYHTMGPYDTIKPSRVKRQQSQEENRPVIAPKPASVTLEKRDSFEGHEEAVRTIVEAVQESRKQQQQQNSNNSNKQKD